MLSQWNPNQIDSQILAIHAALVPSASSDQGEVVLLGGDEHWGNQQESAGNNSWKKTRIYDVATHSILAGEVQSPDSDIFCSHHAFTGDGRLLIAGGTSEWPDGGDAHGHNLDFLGHSRCWLYNARAKQWVETTRLNRNPDQPDEARSGGRWYPGLFTAGDGSAIALFGHLDKNDYRHRNIVPERYFPSQRSWALLPADMGNFGEPATGGRRYLFFPRAYILPSGKMFSATPLPVDFAAQAGGSDGPHFSTAFDIDTAQYTTPRANAQDGVDGDWNFPAAMLPLLPKNGGYNARFFYWSGATPRWIDTDAASPQWTNAGARDAAVSTRQRVYSNMVVLPTGQICVTGGVNVVDPEDGLNQAEIYTPDINWTTNTYGSGGGTWSLEPGTSPNTRNYHSTSLLLPNGKVWVAGGDHNASSGDPAVVGVRQIELFEPPYIAIANRMTISTAPSLVGYGDEFDVVLGSAASNVGRASLIRNGSVTHSTNNDQRYVGLEIVSRSGNTIRFRAPPSGNVAPPGYYMLWVTDAAGVPCQRARFVRVAHLSCRVIANRSTFSEEEVQATGGGSNAAFAEALYADFDGFLDAELSDIPSVAIEWADGSGPVPGSQMSLIFVRSFNEVNPPHPDIPTRVSFAFNLLFGTMDGFSGWLDHRDVIVRFALGSHVCQTLLELNKRPNPYMIDVDPARHNEFWLSTDVRVFKMRPAENRLGATLNMGGNGPSSFIKQVIDNLRGGSASYDSIAPDGPQTVLDGAYMSGTPLLPTFNFAIARVRYRATMTQAQNVRCFFRLCNAASTGLAFNPATVYHTENPASGPVPVLGTAGGEVVSIPFFNAPRVNSVTGQPGATSLDHQTLDPNYDVQTISPDTGPQHNEVTAYFGCYLDINVPTKRFPPNAAGLGPWSDVASRPIHELLRSWHNCLVAEIFYDQDPTRPNAGPADSDNLAQRNLAIIGLENPGLSASRTAMHTFGVAPSRIGKGDHIFSPTAGHGNAVEFHAELAATTQQRAVYPDELFFNWHNLPSDAQVTLYFSDIDTAGIEAMLAARISPPAFTVLDGKTIRFKVGDCGWLPLPGGRETRIPVLISIALPDGIIEGQTYRASVRQVDGRTGRVVGSITIEMPVSKAAFLLPEAERQLSFMGHIATTLGATDHWRPLIERLVGHLRARVDALGGSGRDIAANPDGSGRPYVPIDWQPGDPFPMGGFGSGGAGTGPCNDPGTGGHERECITWPGWLIAAALALALVALGVWPAKLALILVVLALITIALAGAAWHRACQGKFICRLLDKLVLGAVTATGALAIGAVIFGASVRLEALVASSSTVIVAMLASHLRGCQEKCCD